MSLLSLIGEKFIESHAKWDIPTIMNLVEMDPTLLTIERKSKSVLMCLVEDGYIPLIRDKDISTIVALDTLKYPLSYGDDLEIYRSMLQPSVELFGNLIKSEFDQELILLVNNTRKEIVRQNFPCAMYRYCDEIFSLKIFSIDSLDDETIKNIRLLLGRDDNIDKYAEKFFDGYDVDINEVSGRSLTPQIRNLYLKYGKGSLIVSGERPFSDFYREYIDDETIKKVLLRYNEIEMIEEFLLRTMADDEALFFGGWFECSGDIIQRWRICDADDVHELCFDETYNYNVHNDDYHYTRIIGHQDGDNFGRYWKVVFKDPKKGREIYEKIEKIIKSKSIYDSDCESLYDPVLKYEDIKPEHRFDFSGYDDSFCTALDIGDKGFELKLGHIYDYAYHKIIPTIIRYLSKGNDLESIPEGLCEEVIEHGNIGWLFEASLIHECIVSSIDFLFGVYHVYDKLTFNKKRWNDYLSKIET